MNIAQSTVLPESLAAKWNYRFPIGTTVRYWTGSREGIGKVSRTKTTATVLNGVIAVVWLESVSGCVALSHVEPIMEGNR